MLGDFFGVLLPTMATHAPVPSKASRDTSSVPNIALSTEQNYDLPQGLEAHPLIPADINSSQLPTAVSGDSRTPEGATQAHPTSVYAKEVKMSRLIVLKPTAPNLDSRNNWPLSSGFQEQLAFILARKVPRLPTLQLGKTPFHYGRLESTG